MEMNLFERTASRINGYVDEIIEMQSRLTAAQAVGPENGGRGEYDKAEYVKEMVKGLGPDELIEINARDARVPNGYRPNVAALFNGRTGESTLWIITHLDVVPPGDLKFWDRDPFKVELRDGKLYGRGVEDNQQSFVASYMAVKALKNGDVTPYRRVGLLMVSDEETGSERGLKYVLANRMDLFGDSDLFIVPDGGNKNGAIVEVSEKSMLWLKVQTSGKQAHASRPEKAVNSFRAGSHLVTKLDELYDIFDQKDPLYDFPKNSFEPTKKEPNVPNVNTIPGNDVFYIDCRILPEVKVDEVMAHINKMAKEIEARFNVKVNISIVQRADAAPPTPSGASVVKALINAIREVKGVDAKPMGKGGGTVAAFLRRADHPAAVWATDDGTAHQSNEYCILENLISDAKVFLHVALQEEDL